MTSRPVFASIGFLVVASAASLAGAAQQARSVIAWNAAALQAVRDGNIGAPVASRALAVVHACMYDAWVAYDEQATGTQLRGALRRPAVERTQANKERAISYAAYRALSDLFPQGTNSVFRPLMRQLGYDPDDHSTDIETPTGIGNVACAAVLEYRHRDKSNQLGDLAQGAYSDWSGYKPANAPSSIPVRAAPADPDHWQPLIHVNAHGDLMTQRFAAPQWCFVIPFALSKGDEFRSAIDPPPAKYGTPEYRQQAEELIELSARLTDKQKMIAEYWADGPETVQPPGHWMQRDEKRFYDSVRPVTAISVLFRGQKIRSWGGPGKGTVGMDGSEWIPYQPPTSPTPPFPEYVSGHSTYSAAAAEILRLWTGSDRYGDAATFGPGSSITEPGVTPVKAVTLRWETFTEAADEAGMSRRYGGIHFERADLAGRKLGRMVADKVWSKAQGYFEGRLPLEESHVSSGGPIASSSRRVFA